MIAAHHAESAGAWGVIALLLLGWLVIEAWGRWEERRQAKAIAIARHPANHVHVDDVLIVPLCCSDCGSSFYAIPTTGDDCDAVLAACSDELMAALRWHRQLDCRRRVSA